MIPKPDENRAKVEDEPITSELLAKLNAEESVEEGCDVCDGDEPEKSEEHHQYYKNIIQLLKTGVAMLKQKQVQKQ